MSSPEQPKPIEKPEKTPTISFWFSLMLLAIGLVLTGSSFIALSDWAEEEPINPQKVAKMFLAVSLILTMAGTLFFSSRDYPAKLWSYIDYLEERRKEDEAGKAAAEAKYDALDAETLNYRLALRAAVIRADQNLIDELVARKLGGTTPPADDKPAS